MRAVVTSKGQITIPQSIRNQANIVVGSQLDFQLRNDGTIIVHVVTLDISELKGIVKTKRRKPVSLKEMKRAIASGAAESMK